MDSRYKNTLVLSLLHKVAKCLVRHGKNMWFGVFTMLAFVHIHIFVRVYRQWAVWVDCDQEKP